MIVQSCWAGRNRLNSLVSLTIALVMLLVVAPSPARAQAAAQTGTVAGKVVDERGEPIGSAQVFVEKTTLGVLALSLPGRRRLQGTRRFFAAVAKLAGSPYDNVN